MKIPPDLFNAMRHDIRAIVKATNLNLHKANHGTSGLLTMWQLFHKMNSDRHYDDKHPGFVSGKWTRVLPYVGWEMTFKNFNDSHIETALRAIKVELMAEVSDGNGEGSLLLTDQLFQLPLVIVGNV